MVDRAKLVRLKRLPRTNNGNRAGSQSGCEHIGIANDAKVLYRNFSGRPDIYDDNEYYLSSKVTNENFNEFNRPPTNALLDDDDILTDAVDIDAFQLPNKLWDEKVPNARDAFILWVFQLKSKKKIIFWKVFWACVRGVCCWRLLAARYSLWTLDALHKQVIHYTEKLRNSRRKKQSTDSGRRVTDAKWCLSICFGAKKKCI